MIETESESDGDMSSQKNDENRETTAILARKMKNGRKNEAENKTAKLNSASIRQPWKSLVPVENA